MSGIYGGSLSLELTQERHLGMLDEASLSSLTAAYPTSDEPQVPESKKSASPIECTRMPFVSRMIVVAVVTLHSSSLW